MKALLPKATFSLGLTVATSLWAAPGARIAGPWTELRQAPVFSAETQNLAKNWGPALPVGRPFRVEKVYGRWLYGTPEPLPRMPVKEYAKPGWVFSRMLLVEGDEDTLPPALVKQAYGVIFHGREAEKKLGVGREPLVSPLDFLEGLTFSRATLAAFHRQDEKSLSLWRNLPSAFPGPFSFPPAQAADPEMAPAEKALGLSGTDLSFLEQEFQVIQGQKKDQEQKRQALKLKPPGVPALDANTRLAILGRFTLQKYLELPPLTQEEVDGFVYLRATAMRALTGCPAKVQNYWKNRRWNFFRIYRLKSRPEVRHPWFEVSLPGGYFGVSGKAIELAANEAELAFLLVRPLVREMRLQRKAPDWKGKPWPGALRDLSESIWDQTLRAQSTKESENLDVADEIAVDNAATECISRAGYRPLAGLGYLQKIAAKKDEPWARWFFEHSIGLDYRLERLAESTAEAVAKQTFPVGQTTNPKRFSTAARYWNLLP